MGDSTAPGPDASVPQELESIAELTALGQLLRQGRESQGLSLADLAQRLHMGQEQLLALETADRSRLPEPVFVVAQARRVAAFLDLDASAVIEALRVSPAFQRQRAGLNPDRFKAQALSAPAAPPKAPARPSRPPAPWTGLPREGGNPSARLIWILPVGLVVAAAGWGLWSQRNVLAGRLASWSLPVQPAAPRPVATKPELKPALKAQPLKPAAKPAAARPADPAARQAGAVLLVRASQTSWLEVTSLNGQAKLFRGMFRGERRFPLAQGVRLLAGRPDLVLVAVGDAAPKPLGTIKDIRWFQFKGPQPPTAATTAPIKAAPMGPRPR